MIIGIIEAPAVVAADVSIALYRVDKSSGAVIHLAAVAGIGSIDGVDISLDLLHLLLDGSLIGQVFLLHLFDILQGAFHLGLLAVQAGLLALRRHLGIRQVLFFLLHLRLQRPQLGDVIREGLQQGAVVLRDAAEILAVAEVTAQAIHAKDHAQHTGADAGLVDRANALHKEILLFQHFRAQFIDALLFIGDIILQIIDLVIQKSDLLLGIGNLIVQVIADRFLLFLFGLGLVQFIL